MCNRYTISERKLRRESRFGSIQVELEPRYNIAPTQGAPVALLRDGVLRLQELRWGFDGVNGPVMNARSETAGEKRMFRSAWNEGRCIVPADGFYEWKEMPEGKQPYRFVRRDRALFWFAGLHEAGKFTILTQPAKGCVAAMHDRMPLIVADEVIDWWLEPGTAPPTAELTDRAADAALLECYPVTRAMSDARHDTPDCIVPIQLPQGEFSFG